MKILEMGDQYVSQADVNGTILLVDVLLAKKDRRQIHTFPIDKNLSQSEILSYALNITQEFEKAVKKAALKSDISEHRLNIDFIKVQEEVTVKIIGSKFDEIPKILNSYAQKACPSREIEDPSRLSPKKFNKFIVEFNNMSLEQSIQQILYSSKNNELKNEDIRAAKKL